MDTNIFLDVLLNREEWVDTSRDVLNRLEQNPGVGWIAWHTLSNLYYIGRKIVGEEQTRAVMWRIVRSFEVCPAHGRIAVSALELPMADFEDALQVAAGVAAKADWIITRNEDDFKKSPIPALSPERSLQTIFHDPGW
ncbi:MAG: PIN domain-containing protein [Verrucomicrobia bacterium]|nr:PIN domain-containing protein [Verrucomicrobiota bacterium]